MKKERNIKNGTTSKEELDSARRLWLSIICNTGEKKKKQIWTVSHIPKKKDKPKKCWEFYTTLLKPEVIPGEGKGAVTTIIWEGFTQMSLVFSRKHKALA